MENIYIPVIYIAIGLIFYSIVCTILRKIQEKNKNIKLVYKKKQDTTLNLIRSVFKYLIVVIIIIIILNYFGVNTKSIIASLGVAGVVVGLAFQDIVKNLLAGISIIFDNHYMQGDYVTINGFEGEVISLGLQTTKIKAYSGEVMIINNNLITEVINHSMYNSKLVVKFPVSVKTDTKTLDKIINNIDKLIIELPEVKSNIEIKGIDSIDANNYYYRIEVDTKPYGYFGVKREILKLLKLEFEKNNLEIAPEKIDINLKK